MPYQRTLFEIQFSDPRFLVPTMASPASLVRPTVHDVFNFKKMGTVFCNVVSNEHAACMWGREIDAAVLSMITELAAPYIVSPEMYMAKDALGICTDPLLLHFDQDHRQYKWWWGNMDDKDALVDMVALDFGPRIFAGGIATHINGVHESQQCSQAFKHDEHGVPTWYVLVVELRGGGRDNAHLLDLMVHADTKMMEILLFLSKLFDLPLFAPTVMFVWGMDEEGEVDVEDPSACFAFCSENTSAFGHRSFADVFVGLQQVASRMQDKLLEEETEDFEDPYELGGNPQLRVGFWSGSRNTGR